MSKISGCSRRSGNILLSEGVLYKHFTEKLLRELLKNDCDADLLQKQPPEVFYKNIVLKNFAIFTAKHLCPGLQLY